MKYRKFLLAGILFLTLYACEVKPVPINYGSDACDFCSMNIVDERHSAQLVTEKGKNYKFDAIECMVMEMEERNKESWAFILVADFANPGTMINGPQAVFVIDPSVPSPMGADLSAFASLESALAERTVEKIYNWQEIYEIVKAK